MTSRLAGHALVEALIAQGIDTVFGVPGESYLAILDGFHEHRDRIRFVADTSHVDAMGLQWRCVTSDYPLIKRVTPACEYVAPSATPAAAAPAGA